MSRARQILVGVAAVAAAMLLTFILPEFVGTDLATAQDGEVNIMLNEMARISRDDCMDLWNLKMRFAASIKTRREVEANAALQLDDLDTEYNCEHQPRMGEKHGQAGAYICGPSLLAERDECVVYAILGDSDKALVEEELSKDAHCKARLLEPTSMKHIESFNTREVQMKPVNDEKNSPLKLVRTSPKVAEGNLAKVMEGYTDKKYRIDVLRIDCTECDDEFYEELFTLIAADAISVGQLVVSLDNSNTEQIRLVDDWRRTLGYMITRTDVKRSCEGKCGAVSMIHTSEAHNMYRQVHCGDASINLGNHVF